MPLNSRESITPELPLAPLSMAAAALAATSPAPAVSGSFKSSSEAAPMVMDIFDPVSPSGTGKIFRSLT